MNFLTKITLYKLQNLYCLLLLFFLSGCSHLPYEEAPVDTQSLNLEIQNEDIFNNHFKSFLIDEKNYPPNLFPFNEWGLRELLLAQEYFNHDYKIAKKTWQSIQLNEELALLNPPSSVGIEIGRGDSNEEISKNLFGGGFNFTFETANKRLIRHELAFNESQKALITQELIFWEQRSLLIKEIINLAKNQSLIELSRKEVKLKKSILDMEFKRLKVGFISKPDYDLLSIKLSEINNRLNLLQLDRQIILKNIANLVGVTYEKLNLIPFQLESIEEKLNIITKSFTSNEIRNMQDKAIKNNIDLRMNLSEYAIADSELKYEVAKQYPDLVFSPAYVYEFGNNVWKLGSSLILSDEDRNKLMIKKKSLDRDNKLAAVKAAQFKLINELSIVKENFLNLNQQLTLSKELREQNEEFKKQISQRFHKGFIDRMDYEKNLLDLIQYERNHKDAIYNLIEYGFTAETIMQYPIYSE